MVDLEVLRGETYPSGASCLPLSILRTMRRSATADERDIVDIRSGDYTARIDLPATEAPAVRSALRDMVYSGATAPSHAVIVTCASDKYAITVDGVLWAPGEIQTLCDQLVYVLMRSSLDNESQLLHLHGGYVGLDGRGVVIAGLPRSGKSTLVTRLVEAGFEYFTDERIAVDRKLALTPFIKPISLVKGSFALLPHLDPTITGAGCASDLLWHVPASTIGPGRIGGAVEVGMIVFVERRADALPEISPSHPAEMARLLLSDSPDAGRFGAQAVELAANLCASVPCVTLVYGDAEAAVDLIRRLIDAPPPTEAFEVQTFRGRTAPRHAGRPSVPLDAASVVAASAGISGVLVGGRSLLHNAESGAIIELDEALTVWLQLLDGSQTLGQIVDEVADANELSANAVMDIARAMVGQLIEREVVQ